MAKLNLAERQQAQFAPIAAAMSMDAVLPLHEHLLFRVCTLSSRLRAIAFRDVLAEHDIDMRDWLVLAALVEVEKGTQRKISNYTKLDKVAVNRATSRLKERGLVSSRPNLQDGRSHLLELTPAGQELFAYCTQALAEMERKVLQNLDKAEHGSLNVLLSQVEEAVDDVERSGIGFGPGA